MNLRYALKWLYLLVRRLVLFACVWRKHAIRINAQEVQRILLIRIDRIGDMVVSVPAIRAIKEMFPQARITVLTRKHTAPLLESVPWVDEVLVFQSFWATLGQLRRQKFSLAVDLLCDYTLKTALLCGLSRSTVSAGFDIEGRGRLFTIPVRLQAAPEPMYAKTLSLAEKIARSFALDPAKVQKDIPQLVLSRPQKAFQTGFFSSAGLGSKIVVGIQPGAKFPSQCWQPEKFARLSDMIAEGYDATILLMGAEAEGALVEKVRINMKTRPIVCVGLTLDKIVALISGLRLLICNNSGPLHIAAALGVPTVSTMGPTDPVLWQPAGKEHTVVRKELACSPCNKACCAQHYCMQSITVDEMMDAARRHLAERNP